MPESSMEKWPVEIKIVKWATIILGQEFNLYFISGVMNQKQCETVKKRLPINSEFLLASGQVIITSLVSYQQLLKAYKAFTPLAKEFRGRYYVVANEFIAACKKVLET